MKQSKNKIIISIIALAIFLFIVFMVVKKNSRYQKSMKVFYEKYINEDLNELIIKNKEDSDAVGLILVLAIEGYEDWDKLKLSNNFKKRFRNGKNIISNVDEYQHFSSGYDVEFGWHKNNSVWITGDKYDNIFNTLKYGDAVSTEFCFEYQVDENNLLDDIKLIRKKDVFSINGERVDGKKEVSYDYLPYYIHKLCNPNNKDVNEYFIDVPFAKNCQVLNKPNIEELGEPQKSYCKIDGENVTLTFDYGTYKKEWDVKYNIDADFQLDYLEFLEV